MEERPRAPSASSAEHNSCPSWNSLAEAMCLSQCLVPQSCSADMELPPASLEAREDASKGDQSILLKSLLFCTSLGGLRCFVF